MQCPKCGFENIPGREDCVVCSAGLVARQAAESVHPPRAKDRSIRQRIGWRLQSDRRAAAARRRLNDVRPHVPNLGQVADRAVHSFDVAIPRFRARDVWLMFISVVPGLGYVSVGNGLLGWSILVSAVVSLILAAAAYNTYFADLFVYSVIAMSMFSVWSTIMRLRGHHGGYVRQATFGFGLGLMVVSAYLMTYVILASALRPVVLTVSLGTEPHMAPLAQGDALLLLMHGPLHRGDMVVRIVHGDALTPGPVVGMPGDRIDVLDRIYVNGHAVGRLILPMAARDPTETVTRVLARDEYCLLPADNLDWFITPAALADFCIAKRSDIWGRVAAITGPAPRRRLL